MRWWQLKKRDADLERELLSDLELEEEEQREKGLSSERAHYAARRAFGNTALIKEQTREAWGGVPFERLWQDVRFAFRQLSRSPGFALSVVLILALGIGATTAIFSVIDAVIFRALPVENPGQLVLFTWSAHQPVKYSGHSSYGDCDRPNTDCSLSVPFFRAVRDKATSFSGVASLAGPLPYNFAGNGPAVIAQGEYVSGNFFSTLGIKTIVGRPLGPSDDVPSAPPVIVLSHGYWQRAFGADPSAVGSVVSLNNERVTIVGVVEPRFAHLTPGKTEDFLMPFTLVQRVRSEWWGSDDRLANPAVFWVNIIGRLKGRVSLVQAQAEVTNLFRNQMLYGVAPLASAGDDPTIHLLPARQGLNGVSVESGPMLNLIMVAAAMILLIACANVASLLLARSARRQKEMATRQALGASRVRVARQLITEGIVLSFLGGTAGILVSIFGVQALVELISNGAPGRFAFAIEPDWRVIVFTTALTLAAGIISGLVPTLRGTRVDLTSALKGSAAGIAVPSRTGGVGIGEALVVLQVALSVVLLAGAGMLVRTLNNLHQQDPGFDAQNILLFGIDPESAGYTDDQTSELYRTLQQRLTALPGVISASYSENALLSLGTSGGDVHLDGSAPKSNVYTDKLPVGLDFFSTMRIPILSGRAFTSADFASAAETQRAIAEAESVAGKRRAASSEPARKAGEGAHSSPATLAPVPVVINQTFARHFFPNRNPVGLHIGNAQREETPKGPQPGFLVVGVAGDTKYGNLRREVQPLMFMALVGNSAHFELRMAGDPVELVGLVRGVVSEADNELPLFGVHTQTEQVDQTLFQEHIVSRLSSFFAIVAVLLACVGLYGLMAYAVNRRTSEIGIRMALGANRNGIAQMVFRNSAALVIAGLAIGIPIAALMSRLISSQLYGLKPGDPATLLGACFVMMSVTAIASYLPARRAASIDPMRALRTE